jgi:hypothetical protein
LVVKDMLTYAQLKERPRELLAATGLMGAEFEQLLPAFESAYSKQYPPQRTLAGKPRQRRPGGGAKGVLDQPADRLLFILVYLKTNPLQTMHGLQFGLSQSQTNYWIHHLLPVVQAALQALGMTPERDGSKVAESALADEGTPDLALDGTERRRQRPQAATEQKEHYSGKKKTHTDKNIVLINESTSKVVYLGPTEPGSKHDKKAADEAAIVYPSNATLDQDTGFQGYAPADVLVRQPKKKPRGRERSQEDKFLNQIIASVRIEVEHVIAGIKRCRIVKDVLRLTREGISDLIMEIACGLHNLRITCRHPLPDFDLRNLLNPAYSR